LLETALHLHLELSIGNSREEKHPAGEELGEFEGNEMRERDG
jgi:hypothetical protein